MIAPFNPTIAKGTSTVSLGSCLCKRLRQDLQRCHKRHRGESEPVRDLDDQQQLARSLL